MTPDHPFEVRLRAALRGALDERTGPHPIWAESPLAARLADPLGHRGPRRWARTGLLVAAVLVVSGVAIAGALRLQQPQPSPDVVTNGWIAFAANGDAGDDLRGVDVSRNGDRDVYLAIEGVPPRRVMGDERDSLSAMCAAFAPDGGRLALVELDLRSLTSTPPPVAADDDATDDDAADDDATDDITPESEGPGDEPEPQATSDPDPPAWRIVVAGVDEVGDAPILAQLDAQPSLSSCAKWSPDGQRLAYVETEPDGRQQLLLVTLAGATSALGPRVRLGDTTNLGSQADAFDWAPDGATIAMLGDDRLWLLPVEGGDTRALPGQGYRSVRWSPDGTRLAFGLSSLIRISSSAGATVADVSVATGDEVPPAFAWAPDGHALAYTEGAELVIVSTEGLELQRVPIDLGVILGQTPDPPTPSILQWAPDSRSVLLGVGGIDSLGSIVSVPLDAGGETAVIAGPTYALRGVDASWQAVHE